MKTKKLHLTKIIFAVTVVAMVICVLICGIAKKPTITEGEFPYSVTYSVKGEIKTLEGVYKAAFVGNESYADNVSRVYDGDDETWFTVFEDETGDVQLITHMYADYLMGDSQSSDYFGGGSFAPELVHYDAEGYEITDAEILAERDVEIIEWDYPEPLENKLVFSHFAAMSGRVVLPLTIIALLALLAVLILVKREETVEKGMAYRFHGLLNFAVCIIGVPLFTALGLLSDIIGTDNTVSHQITYLIAPVTALGVAAAVALRRKGFGKAGFIAQFAGVVLLGVMMLFSLLEGTAY